jgi:hypothetical protein
MTTILAMAALAAPCVAEQVAIDLREAVSVEGAAITLAQLAEITPAQASEAIGAVEVGPSPLPGDSRELTRGYLKMRLRRGGMACDEIAFTGAKTVEVRRALPPATTQPRAQGEVEAADPPGARRTAPPRPTIDRGGRVRLTVICGAVAVGAEATLLEDAVVGGRAKMRVEQTRETVVAQIVQPSEAVMRRE